MNHSTIEPARFEHRDAMYLVGPRARLTQNAAQDIQIVWEQLVPHLGTIPEQIGTTDYGLCIGVDDSAQRFDYMAAIAMPVGTSVPTGWSQVSVPAQNYAVFPHTQHVSQVRHTIEKIFAWLATADCQLAEQGAEKIHFFERYGESFNPETGMDDIEIWLPLKP